MKKKILIIGSIFIGLSAIVILNKNGNNKDILLEDKIVEEKTVAMYKSDDGSNYTEIDAMPESGYVINEEKSYCTRDNITHDEDSKLKTVDGNHTISGLKKSSKCYVWFDKAETPITIPDIIAGLNVKTETPDFSQAATTDEGVYATSDGMYGGTSYYWRGVVTTNHVIFANKCWRIVRINGDKSMRLIYNGTVKSGNVCTGNGSNSEAVIMGSTDDDKKYNIQDGYSSYVGWTYVAGTQRTLGGDSSNIKVKTENWYTINITGESEEKVADGKFCNDRNAESGSTWRATGARFNYAGYKRLYTDFMPSLSCSTGDIYTLKVGAITADEVEFAGGKDQDNNRFYINLGKNYWTMTPYIWGGSSASVFIVASSGYLTGNGIDSTTVGIRPVINLKSDTTFQLDGLGTLDNPYIVLD